MAKGPCTNLKNLFIDFGKNNGLINDGDLLISRSIRMFPRTQINCHCALIETTDISILTPKPTVPGEITNSNI